MVKYNTLEELINAMSKFNNKKMCSMELQYASEELKSNPAVIRDLITRFGTNALIQYASDELKKDKDFILEFNALQYASEELKDDKEFILQFMQKEGNGMYYVRGVSERLKQDREVVLAAVKSCGEVLIFVPDELKNDREIVIEAVKSNATAIAYIGEKLKEDDVSILAQGIREGHHDSLPSFWEHFDEGDLDEETINRYKSNKEIIIAMINRANLGEMALNDWASEDLVKSKEFIMEAMQYVVENADEMADRIRDGRYAPEDVVTDKLQSLLRQMDESLKGDEEIAKYAIGHGADLICVGKELRDNPELRTLSEEAKKKKVYRFYSASDVAELDGIKTSDIDAAFQETIKGKDISKDETTQTIDE